MTKANLVRVRVSKGVRIAVTVPPHVKDVEARTKLIAEVARKLVTNGLALEARRFATQIMNATTARELEVVVLAAKKAAKASDPIIGKGETFGSFAKRWTSGELARQYPDHVSQKKSWKEDAGRLKKHVLKHVKDVPLASFSLAHAQTVMRALDPKLSAATRRHVAQVMYRILRIAVFPARVIPVCPLPVGFLPKISTGKAKTFLYPDEDAKLLACKEIPLARRIFWGYLSREGMREGEALGLEWTDLDLERGTVTLDRNKTNDARSWVLDPGVVRALTAWRKLSKGRPFNFPARHLADQLRADLALAGVDRAELSVKSEARRPIRVHDLRATFTTLSLANGKTEAWVMDRTGHRSSTMVAKYRRVSRTAAELQLGVLAPLDEALDLGTNLGSGWAP